MKITHHKNGEIKTLVDEAPYHPGYEDVGFKPKAVNNKPVAWMSPDGKVSNTEGKLFYIPLYTHPVKAPMMVLDGNRVYPAFKQLTDEEIENIAENCWKTDEDLQFFDYNKFAKAILRKAQEK